MYILSLTMLSVPTSLDKRGHPGNLNSSGIDPSFDLVNSPLPGTVNLVLGSGPPVPALLLVGSRLKGQPNWFMN